MDGEGGGFSGEKPHEVNGSFWTFLPANKRQADRQMDRQTSLKKQFKLEEEEESIVS